MERKVELSQIEQTLPKQQQSWYPIITIFILSILYLYVAIKEYPKWRKMRENFFTKSTKSKTSKSDTKTETTTDQKNALLYVPFIPLAAIYLTLRIIWDTFRLFVFYSLDLIEVSLIAFWNFLMQNIKMIPKICAEVPLLWDTYIQKPFLKISHLWLDWMYLHAWPVLKSMAITTWNISVVMWEEGQKATIYSWKLLVEYSEIGWNEIIFPSLNFMSWATTAFIYEPGKWLVSRSIYLGKVFWYCACFLARDLAEDFKELSCVGWKISVLMYDNVLQPAGKLIYEKIRYYSPKIQRFLYIRFILAITNDAIYMIQEICRDPLFRSCAERIYSIIQSAVLYNLIKKLANDIFSKLQIIKPRLVNRIRQCGLELVEFTFISTLEVSRSAYSYYAILLPIFINIPVIYNEFKHTCNEFYRNVKERVSKILKSLWTVFAPLLRPVILALSFFYTTVILVVLLFVFRMASRVVSILTIAFNKALVILQKGLSTLHSMLELIYNALLPYVSLILQTSKDVIYELYITINNLMTERFPLFMNYFTGIISGQVQILKDHAMNAYEKYEPIIVELKDRAKVAADEFVFSIGQNMVEWVKKERALKEGASFKEE